MKKNGFDRVSNVSWNVFLGRDDPEIRRLIEKRAKQEKDSMSVRFFSLVDPLKIIEMFETVSIGLAIFFETNDVKLDVSFVKQCSKRFLSVSFVIVFEESSSTLEQDSLGTIRLVSKGMFDKFLEQCFSNDLELCSEKFPGFLNLIGNASVMLELFGDIRRIAGSDASVLICGESGSGKELVARAIHVYSPRKSGPFIPINCAAIPQELLESELFGHEKGAFTGAVQKKLGYFELAHAGTLFLDEIGDLKLDLQVKLLRVLESGEVSPVGGSGKKVKIDIRIVAATHRDLRDLTRKKLFRQDLYFRLKVLDVFVPPLRERKEDIPLLLEYFCLQNQRKYPARPQKTFSPEAVKQLQRYGWPGNVRELSHMTERIFLIVDEIIVDTIPAKMFENLDDYDELKKDSEDGSGKKSGVEIHSLREAEIRAIHKALVFFQGDMNQAAKALQITPKELRRKIERNNLFDSGL